jgi:protein phosphatase
MTGQQAAGATTGAAMVGTPAAADRDRHAAEVPPRVFGATDIGRVRKQNQDAFGFSPDGSLLVVADGMGGYDFGDIASGHAVEAVLGFMADRAAWETLLAESGPGAVLLQATHFAHEQLTAEAATDPLRRKMGTTLLVAWLLGDTLHTCHVGDSRAYVLRGGGLHQLTRDHSVVEVLVRTGQITAGQARFDPRRNQLTQAVGLSGIIGPTLNELALDPGNRLLLCSDGLWGPLPETELVRRLATDGPIAEAGRCLVDGANLFGGSDNITVVVYEHGGGEG